MIKGGEIGNYTNIILKGLKEYMTYQDLLSTYSWTGDIICLCLCLCLLFMIKRSIIKSADHKIKIVISSLVLVAIGAVSNTLFYFSIMLNVSSHALLFLFRDINHLCLLFVLQTFVYYVTLLLDLPKKHRDNLVKNNLYIYAVGMILDLLSPITHFGFYVDDNQLWHDSTYLKPFTLVYIFFLAEIIYLFVHFQKRVIIQIMANYLLLGFVCVSILLIENAFDSNTYTTFTFLLPIIFTIILLHSNPYDLNTGALSRESLDAFLQIAKKENKKITYIVLKLFLNEYDELPNEVGREMHIIGRKNLKHLSLFSITPEYYVLAIDVTSEKIDVLTEIRRLINQEFAQCYKKYRIDYKILIIHNLNYHLSPKDMMPTINYLESLIQRNDVIFTDEELIQKLVKKSLIANELEDIYHKKNLNDNRILAFCQPIKNVNRNDYTTAEALMRMQLPNLGFVFPDEFIPVAESYGYIHVLSLIILNKVCQEIAKFEHEGKYIERISVNFSVSEFENADFSKDVLEIIEANKIPCSKIGIEITESKNVKNSSMIEHQIEILRARGITFYLDDFGIGYSNFDRIMSMGFDVIKFDRSLLLHMDSHMENQAIVNSFASAFHQLQYYIVFEGVENDDNEILCKRCGADFLQGYKYSKPIPIEQLHEYLSAKETIE